MTRHGQIDDHYITLPGIETVLGFLHVCATLKVTNRSCLKTDTAAYMSHLMSMQHLACLLVPK